MPDKSNKERDKIVREIPLNKGVVALVSERDYSEVSRHRWYVNDKGRVVRSRNVDGRRRTVYMHREIMEAPKDVLVDHANGNLLDNRRLNLRFATKSQNNANWQNGWGKCKYRGVHYCQTQNKGWVAQIWFEGKSRVKARFPTAKQAALWRDMWARRLHGKFAHLNFPDEKYAAMQAEDGGEG